MNDDELAEIRANLKEAIARGREPYLSAVQCAALVALIDGATLLERYVSLDELSGKADNGLYREARAALSRRAPSTVIESNEKEVSP